MPPYLQFWGKARGERQGEPGWHSVVYHNLDVAAVAEQLLAAFPRPVAHLARQLGTSRENLSALLVAMIALHDIGKFGSGFQLKSPEHWPVALLGSLPKPGAALEGDHARLASRARRVLGLRAAFGAWVGGWQREDFDALWHAIAGHHGQPRVQPPATDLRFDLPPAVLEAARAFRDDVLALFPDAAALPVPPPGDRRLGTLTWFAAGLAVAADWIGSNRTWFPYIEATKDVRGYWSEAQSKAKAAVAKSGLLPVVPNPALKLSDLLPLGAAPSPLQEAMAHYPLPDGPSLTIIEEVTGAGKSEAAMMLAGRLLGEGRASGLYFALPTMATADAMYRRMTGSYRKLFAPDTAPSLILAHGKRSLNDGFQGSIELAEVRERDDAGDYPDEGSAVCVGWLADDRRKTFLAHVGVGTIDQALLGVLPSKYQSLRLWGLADKVLVLDEVHCYDAYVSRELERLLEFHAALGGSSILLSATLPTRQKGRLLAAFERGLGKASARPQEQPEAYPLISATSSAGRSYAEPNTRLDRQRSLAVQRIDTVETAVDKLITAARQGAAVAWVRNAVDDAIEAAELLKSLAPDLRCLLLHSRFAMGHRLEKEEIVRTVLGRGDHAERKGFVLIGTQILEASLDYDVDLMVSDLAPVDLLIQRAGRIGRHSDRKNRPLAPKLLVLAPDPNNAVTSDWYSRLLQRASHVYAHHGVVWRSASALFSGGKIETPEGVRSLVEAVYGRDREDLDDVPPGLHAASDRAFGKENAARSFANANLLEPDAGYAGDQNIWQDDTVTPTRLGEEVTVFRLARWHDGEIVPLCGGDTSMKSWALSEVSIRSSRASGEATPAGGEAAVLRAKSHWPAWEQQMPLVVLSQLEDGVLKGSARKAQDPVSISYDIESGLRVRG